MAEVTRATYTKCRRYCCKQAIGHSSPLWIGELRSAPARVVGPLVGTGRPMRRRRRLTGRSRSDIVPLLVAELGPASSVRVGGAVADPAPH